MEANSICIRRAQTPDKDDIFWLLHSESITWNTDQIKADINNLYVMTCKDKLIGAAYCKLIGSRIEFYWVAIHPMYPEDAMSSILRHSLKNMSFNLSSSKLKLCHQ